MRKILILILILSIILCLSTGCIDPNPPDYGMYRFNNDDMNSVHIFSINDSSKLYEKYSVVIMDDVYPEKSMQRNCMVLTATSEIYGEVYIYICKACDIDAQELSFDTPKYITENFTLYTSEPLTDSELEEWKSLNNWDLPLTDEFHYDPMFELNGRYLDENDKQMNEAFQIVSEDFNGYDGEIVDDNSIACVAHFTNDDEIIVAVINYFNKETPEVVTIDPKTVEPLEYSKWLSDNYWSTWSEYIIYE